MLFLLSFLFQMFVHSIGTSSGSASLWNPRYAEKGDLPEPFKGSFITFLHWHEWWIWKYQSHLTNHQLNIGNFLRAVASLFPDTPSPAEFDRLIVFWSLLLDFLCANPSLAQWRPGMRVICPILGHGFENAQLGHCFYVLLTTQGETMAKPFEATLLRGYTIAIITFRYNHFPCVRPAHVAESGARVSLQELRGSGSKISEVGSS